MKRLVLGGEKAWSEQAPKPEPEPGWVVVRPTVLPICGSDIGAFVQPGEHRYAGHEGTGTVEAVAPGSRFEPGDRVAIGPSTGCGECAYCRSGSYIYCADRPEGGSHFAEYVKKQEFILARLPDDVSFEAGSLVGCALGPATSAMRRLEVGAHDTVMIAGLGPVGLGATAVATFLGARVAVVEPEPYRIALAEELGAHDAFDPTTGDPLDWVRDLTGRGVTCAVDCSGSAEAERLCVDAVAPLGRVAFLGENAGQIEVSPSRDFIRKGLTVIGSWSMDLGDYDRMFDLLRRKPETQSIATHVYPFEEAQAAFEKFLTRQTGKVLLKL